jgi:hypothetical protein
MAIWTGTKLKLIFVLRLYRLLAFVEGWFTTLAAQVKKAAWGLHLDRDAVGQIRTIAPGIVARARFGFTGEQPEIDFRATIRPGVVWTCKVKVKVSKQQLVILEEDSECCGSGRELVFPDPDPHSLVGGMGIAVKCLPVLSDEEREEAKKIKGLIQSFLNDPSQERKTLLEDIRLAGLKFWRVQ